MNCVWSLTIFRSNNIRSRNNGFRISQNFLCWSSELYLSDLEGNSRCLISLEEENINRIDIDTVRLPNIEGLSERVLLVLFDNDLFNFNSLNLSRCVSVDSFEGITVCAGCGGCVSKFSVLSELLSLKSNILQRQSGFLNTIQVTLRVEDVFCSCR